MALSLVYIVGCLVVALVPSVLGMKIGLLLIAIGSGGIKPCVSANVGDQFKEDQKDRMREIFNIFYFTINFGSFFASLLIPILLAKFNPTVAFMAPAILMMLATFIFWLGRHQYVRIPPTGFNRHGMLFVLWSAIKNFKRRPGPKLLDGALVDHRPQDLNAVRAVFRIMGIFLLVSCFWALFDQHSSTWITQASKMNGVIGPWAILPAQTVSMNPILVMILIPIFVKFIYPGVEKLGIHITPLRKMSAGMVLAAVAFLEVTIIEYGLSQGMRLHMLWQFLPYLTLTMAEVMVSVTGLEFAYTQAPPSMKSTIMSLWLLTTVLGNLITATMAKGVFTILPGVSPETNFFAFFTLLMLIFAGCFIVASIFYRPVKFSQE
jgi:POT family proton-dependent oligopeptide transporter